ncbi:MAG: ATP-binding protein [Polyangiales bacterium]
MTPIERKRARLAELESEAARLRSELAAELGASNENADATLGSPLRSGLSKREALLVEAERVAHLGSWAWDLKRDEIGWSDEFYRILGLDPACVTPSSEAFFSAIHVEDRERVRAESQHAFVVNEVQPCEFRIVRPTGELREVRMEGVLLHDLEGRQAHMVGTVLDVTERRRSAQLFARTVAELNEAQRIAGLASWRWDMASSQLEWSAGMYRLLDIPATLMPSEELFLKHVHFDDQDRVRKVRQQVLDTVGERDAEPMEFRIIQTSGKILAVVQYAVAQWDAAGTLLGFRGVIQDITERKALEEQLRHSQKMEAVGTLAGGVAHDFNNYLMVIAGYTELLGEELPPEHPARESVSAIAEAYQRCAHLTQQLLTLSRKRTAQPIPVDLSALIAQLSPLLRSVLGELVQLNLQLPPTGMSIVADPLQVEQALMNLVVNARDAMPGGGELSVHVEPRFDEAGERALVRMSVIDRGCGIPSELRSRIFEPFFTTKQSGHGTGLGLSTVYAIVRDAGGQITFESEPGAGTSFHIDWPRSETSLDSVRKSQPPRAEESIHGRTILLVEDVARVRELLAQQLERAGYRVRSAPHGVAALELLGQQHFDLVISDMIMPQLGGLGLARTIRERHPGVLCLLMTGYAPEAVQGSDQVIDEPLLRKPFSNSELLRAVRRALRGQSSM